MPKPSVLIVLADGVEELEAASPIDLLRRADVQVTVVSATASRRIEGRNGIVLEAEMLLEETEDRTFDMIIIPGGPGHKHLAEHRGLRTRLQRQAAADGWIASICAGPVVLKAAGVLEGHRYTSFPATVEELPDRIPDEAVVVDGKLVTSQGAGTAFAFALTLVECLKGPEAREEIASSTCWNG